jgi:16S rRNA (guanine527-N7)-methyltransferase
VTRLAELAVEWDLPAEGVHGISRWLSLVASDPHAPTTVRDLDQAVNAHVADALSGLMVPKLAAAARVADLGAGAGAPGLILAAARPAMRVTEVESVGRKCAFMERAIATMGLANADVACARVEEWTAGHGVCDAVTARALAPLPVLVEYAAPLLADRGVLVAWKGAPELGEEADGAAAATVLGLELSDVVEVPPFPGADRRRLYVYLKVRSLPNGYPRRAGMARKRPLSASG